MASLALLVGSRVEAATLYADATLAADITDGTYSIAKRGPGGKDGNAYKTIQAAVEVMEPGDTLLLRGGTFKETDIQLVRKGTTRRLAGTAEQWLTIRGYPGEWAVVDGEHREESGGGKITAYSVFNTAGTRGNAIAYWRFEYFEVTGGGPALKGADGNARTYQDIASVGGKGFHFWPAYNIVFDHMSVHGNYGGGGPNGGAGISIQGENGGVHDIHIRYCWLYDNGWPATNHGNLSNITLFADYAWNHFPDIDVAKATFRNVIEYNLIEDTSTGFRHKGSQFLCLDHEGKDMAAKELGDKITNNIFRNCNLAIESKADFAQVHNNLIIDCAGGIGIGSPPSTGYREMFHVLVYNNTVFGSKNSITTWKGWNEKACNYLTGPYHPHFHVLNNIIFDDNTNARTDACPLRIDPTYNKSIDVDMQTMHLRNTLFCGRHMDDMTVRVGSQNLSLTQAAEQGWAKDVWAMPMQQAEELFQGTTGISRFLPRRDAMLGGKPISAAGAGGAHPYLDGVMIPSYVGAVDPADTAWAKDVENLRELGKSIMAAPSARK